MISDEKVYHINMGKFIIKTFKRTLAVILALILLININAEAFAALNLPQNEEISKEIRNVLEESFLSSESSVYKNCVNNNSVLACQNYLGDIKAQFIQSGKNSKEEKSTLEGKKSYKEYEKEYKAALAEEYNKAEEEIEKETREAVLFNEFSWDTLNEIKYQEKKAKEELKKWKESEEKKIKSSYGQYEREYTAWKAKEAKQQEEAGKKYLREEAKKIIQAYYATESKAVKRAARELLLILLNSEEKPGEIIEERESLERIFLEALANKPCDYTKGSKTLTKGGADKYIGYDKPGVYPTLTQEDWQIIEARYKDEEGCKSAFISLEGLSHLKATENSINKVERFIEENEEGLAAGDSLVNGSAVLLRWKAYQNLKRYIKKRFVKEETNEGKGIGGFGEISEKIAYNGNYLGKVSVWSQRADGSNAWEDLAELLAEEGSAQSKEILKSAVSSCKIENHALGKDKLVCQTIMPFLYGAILHAPKVIDEAKPYQERIPKNREYLDEQGRTRQVDVEAIKRRNNYIEQNFRSKLQEYGSNLSSGLAGFIYKIKFNDVPVDSKMALDNKLAKVYSNIKGYSKGSARYNKLKAGRAVVAIFKYVGIAVDVIFTFTLVGDLAKGALGARALIKAKNILKGKTALSVAQRANILRQVAYIKEGGKLRRFGRKIGAGVVNSANIGRKINASAYLAEKNGMNPISYMLHNIAYQRGKNIVLRNNILRVEGSTNFFNSSHYRPEIHGDIFRINRDLRRASKIGISELGEGGQVVSYIDKAKVKIFKEYTQDYIKGQDALTGTQAGAAKQELMSGETTLLPREYLYSRKYRKVLPFAQNGQFSRTFKIGDEIYEGLRREGLFVINKETGEVFNDFRFNFDGYLKKNNLLIGRQLGRRLPKPQVENPFGQGFANIGKESNFAQGISLISGQSSLATPVALYNKTPLALTAGLPVLPSISSLFNPIYAALNIKNGFPWLNTKTVNPDGTPQVYVGESVDLKPKYLKPITKENIAPGSDTVIDTLNEMLARLNYFAANKELTPKKLAFYEKLSKEIYALAETSDKITWEKLEGISELIDILSAEKPLFVFYGYNLDQVLRPKDLPEEEFFIFDLANSLDYQKDFAERIKMISSIFDEYTIYTFIHGSKEGYLKLNANKKAYITDIADIIEENKGSSIVNWVSGSCHSGAGFSRSLIKPGLNILLISGVNDICYYGDTQFVKVNDLISSYYNVILAKRYGSVLIYDGKMFNSIKQAKNRAIKEQKTELVREFHYLNNIFSDGDKLGINIFNFLKNFPKWQMPDFSLEKLKEPTKIPFIFNPKHNIYSYITNLTPPIGSKKFWMYEVKSYDVYGKKISDKEYPIIEKGNEIDSLLRDITRELLEKHFPKWKYEPMSPVSSIFVPMAIGNSSLKASVSDFSALKTSKDELANVWAVEYDEALKRALEQANKIDADREQISTFFKINEESIINAIEIIGLDGFVHCYQGKLKELKKIIEYADFIKTNFSPEAYELLLQKTNPKKSQKYKKLTEEMNALREKAKNDPAFREERDKITSLQRRTAKGEGLLIHDVLDKFKAVAIIAQEDLAKAQDLVNYILPKTPENELVWRKKCQAEVFRQMRLPYFDGLVEKANLDKINSSELLILNKETKKNLKEIFTLLKDNPDKNIADIMDALPWNKKTKKIFEKLKIDYDAWTKPDPDNFVEDIIHIDIVRESENFVKDVNFYVNMWLKNSEDYQLKAIEKGITLQQDPTGKTQILFEGKPVESFTQAARVVSNINKIIYPLSKEEKNNFYITKITQDLPHLSEVLSTIAKEKQVVKVRLADTSDIGAMLALGRESACCRALGGTHERAGVSLITNKVNTAFEILVNDNAIGSIMVYLAQVDGNLAMVLGTLETRAIYSNNLRITKAVVNFARQFAAKIGKPDIPIYTAVQSQAKTMKEFADPKDLPIDERDYFDNKRYQVKLLGKIGKHPAYLSYNYFSENRHQLFSTTNYLYHLDYPFEKLEKVNLNPFSQYVSLNKQLLDSLMRPSLGIVPGPLALVMSEMNRMQAKKIDWTEESARNYLKNNKLSKDNISYLMDAVRVNGNFSPELFDIFVKGYEVNHDFNFAIVAWTNSYVGGNVFDYDEYARIYSIAKRVPKMNMDHIKIYKDATAEELKALFYIAENYPKINPFEVMNMASNYPEFKTGELNYEIYNRIVDFLSKGLSLEALKSVFNVCLEDNNHFNEDTFSIIKNIANIAVSRKEHFLSANNKNFTEADIKDFIYRLSPEIMRTLELCDNSTLLAALDLKMVKFEKFIRNGISLNSYLTGYGYYDPLAMGLFTPKNIKEDFLTAFYPSNSMTAQRLQQEIAELKRNFTPELKDKINTATKELRDLLKQEKVFSPQEKIEIINIMANFSDKKQLLELISASKQGKDSWYQKLHELIKLNLKGIYNDKIEEKLHLLDNPYLGGLFISIGKNDFKLKFQELLVLLSREDFGKSLDKLRHNVATQESFESFNLNYKRYTNPKESFYRSFYDGKNLVEIRQVNMRDVSKSLFIGNVSHACTAIGSDYDAYAIPYIMNTFAGALEVLVNGDVVGNAMIYPILKKNIYTDKKGALWHDNRTEEVAILIDDLKLLAPYNKYKYLQEVVYFTEDIAKNIGINNKKVYIANAREIPGYDKFELGADSEFYLIGKTLDPIWLDAISREAKGGHEQHIEFLVPSDKVK